MGRLYTEAVVDTLRCPRNACMSTNRRPAIRSATATVWRVVCTCACDPHTGEVARAAICANRFLTNDVDSGRVRQCECRAAGRR